MELLRTSALALVMTLCDLKLCSYRSRIDFEEDVLAVKQLKKMGFNLKDVASGGK